MGKHGKEQGIQVASDIPPVLGAEHVDIGVVGLYDAGESLLLELEELDGLDDLAVGEARAEGEADDIL